MSKVKRPRFFHRNEIAELEDVSFLHLKDTVSTIFLGENDITRLPPTFFKSFRRLIWLDLAKNHLRSVAPGSLPASLTTLSLSHNHFVKFPLDLTDSLPELTWYSLRGNYIEAVPLEPLNKLRQLDRLDLLSRLHQEVRYILRCARTFFIFENQLYSIK